MKKIILALVAISSISSFARNSEAASSCDEIRKTIGDMDRVSEKISVKANQNKDVRHDIDELVRLQKLHSLLLSQKKCSPKP